MGVLVHRNFPGKGPKIGDRDRMAWNFDLRGLMAQILMHSLWKAIFVR